MWCNDSILVGWYLTVGAGLIPAIVIGKIIGESRMKELKWHIENLQEIKGLLQFISKCKDGRVEFEKAIKWGECFETLKYFIRLAEKIERIEGSGLLPKKKMHYGEDGRVNTLPSEARMWNACQEEIKLRLVKNLPVVTLTEIIDILSNPKHWCPSKAQQYKRQAQAVIKLMERVK